MTGSEMQEVVRIVTDSVMAAVERRISSLGVSVRPATVTQESPLMVRLDGAKTPAPARVSGELSVGSRVLVLSSGTTLSVIGGSDGGDVEVSDLAGDFVLPVSKGGTGVTRSTSNSVHKNAVPIVGGDGVMEVGQYIDMHYGDNATDYDLRISVGSSGSPSFSKPVPVSSGGTGATSAAAARSSLGAGTPYSLPAATASTRGGVRVGSGLKVSGDVLSVDNGAYVRASGSYRVFVGSKNVTVSNTTPLLFNESQYLCVMTNEATGAPMQVNYVIFAYNA